MKFKCNVGKVEIHGHAEAGGSTRKSIRIVLDVDYSDDIWVAAGRLSQSEAVVDINPRQTEMELPGDG